MKKTNNKNIKICWQYILIMIDLYLSSKKDKTLNYLIINKLNKVLTNKNNFGKIKKLKQRTLKIKQ